MDDETLVISYNTVTVTAQGSPFQVVSIQDMVVHPPTLGQEEIWEAYRVADEEEVQSFHCWMCVPWSLE